MIEVDRAMFFALHATISGAPRVVMMNPTPTSGRKVTGDRSGQWFIVGPWARSPREQIPGDQRDDADQHGKGIVIDIAGLQPARFARGFPRAGSDAVDCPIDDHPVTGLPQPVAEAERAAHEHAIIE